MPAAAPGGLRGIRPDRRYARLVVRGVCSLPQASDVRSSSWRGLRPADAPAQAKAPGGELRTGLILSPKGPSPPAVQIWLDKTTGAPLTILFENTAAASADYTQFRAHPRPSHADFAADAKFNGFNDLRGGGHLSGRITLALVAAGVVAKKILDQKGLDIEIKARLKSILSETNPDKWEAIIKSAQQEEDSVGGELICITDGLPAGCGEPFFNSIESQIAHLAFSIPGVKAIAFGDFSDINSSAHIAASSLKGSAYNDMIADINGHTATNHSGGINGGISNGNPLVFSLDIRPPASISKVQNTMNFQTGQTEDLHITGRHDTCFALRCPVIAEAITYIVLADNLL